MGMSAAETVDVWLYGAPASLYTAKVRAALRAQRIAHIERMPSHPRYRQTIKPQVESHRIPAVEFADGEVLQDSTLILDRLEARFPDPVQAGLGPRQRLITGLMELVGDRGLSKAAMHYRWNFLEANRTFVVGEFGRALGFPAAPAEIERHGARIAARMTSYLPLLGIDESSIPAIERSYRRTLSQLEAHFSDHPYLLGDAPTRADYCLMGPLYGHLARDPYPLRLMQQTAPLVFRWTERINGGDRESPEFPDRPRAVVGADEIPPLVVAWLRDVFEPFADELIKSAELFNAAARRCADAPCGTPVDPGGADQPALGEIVVDYYGTPVRQQALGHSLWLLQRVLDDWQALAGPARAACGAVISSLNLERLFNLRLVRRLDRVRGRLVFG